MTINLQKPDITELKPRITVFGVGAGYDFAIGSGASLGIDAEATDASTRYRFVDGTDSLSISAGRDLYAVVAPKALDLEQRIFSQFGKAEVTTFTAMLRRIEELALALEG